MFLTVLKVGLFLAVYLLTFAFQKLGNMTVKPRLTDPSGFAA
jgi:hypothetical protein